MTPTVALEASVVSAISTAAEVSGYNLRLARRPDGFCVERKSGGTWIIDSEVFQTAAEVRAFALGFAGGVNLAEKIRT